MNSSSIQLNVSIISLRDVDKIENQMAVMANRKKGNSVNPDGKARISGSTLLAKPFCRSLELKVLKYKQQAVEESNNNASIKKYT